MAQVGFGDERKRPMVQVGPVPGAGGHLGTKGKGPWRRYTQFLAQYAPFLAQVGFLVGDLRRKMGS